MAADSSLCVETSTLVAMNLPQSPSAMDSPSPVILTPTNKRGLQEEFPEQSHSKKRPLTFVASWQKKTYTMFCTPEETVQQLKIKLQELTNVRPQNMKL